MRGVNGGLCALQVNGAHIQSAAVIVTVIASRRYMMNFNDLFALQCFKVDVEAPQAVQMFQDLVG